MIVSGFTQRQNNIKTGLMDELHPGQHSHCVRCRRIECTQFADYVTACAMATCEACGWKCHECKREEHRLTCPEERVPCINKSYGCPLELKRSKMAGHLPVCPASVVCCVEEWSRWPMHSADKGVRGSLPVNKTYLDCGQLDVGLAMRDQRMLIDSLRAPKRLKHSLRNPLTRKYPAAPLMAGRSSSFDSEPETSTETSQTSDDETDVPWNLARCHPGLRDSINSKLFLVTKETTDSLALALDQTCNVLSGQNTLPKISETGDGGDERKDSCRLSGAEKESLSPQPTLSGDCERSVRCSLSADRESESSSRSGSVLRDIGGSQLHKVLGIEQSDLPKSEICLHDVLGVNINYECFNKFMVKPARMYTFICAQHFRRDQFVWHFKNIHEEIQQGFSGWLEKRCPLAYLGCPFSYQHMLPDSPGATLYHSWLHESFGVKTQDQSIPAAAQSVPCSNKHSCNIPNDTCPGTSQVQVRPVIFTAQNWDSKVLFEYDLEEEEQPQSPSLTSLTDLPFEVLQLIASRLDSFSLRSLSLTCHLLREVCCRLLDEHGIVLLNWERQKLEGGVTWTVSDKRWLFTTSFDPIRSWKFNEDHVTIGDHLKTCPYNQDVVQHSKPFAIINDGSMDPLPVLG